MQGPRQSPYNLYSGALRAFALSIYFKRRPVIYEDGSQLRDYVNIEDVVGANLLALEDSRTNYQVYNVGGGKGYSVLELAEAVAGASGKDGDLKISGEFRYGDTRHVVSDINKLKRLGWEPMNSLEKSVNDYVSWLREEKIAKDITEFAQKKMKQLGVVRYVQSHDSG